MKRSRFSEEQIIGILKEHQAGLGAKELCRKHGVSDPAVNTTDHPLRTAEQRRRKLTFAPFC